MQLTNLMAEILDRPGAQLVHPAKAYVFRHLTTPDRYLSAEGMEDSYLSRGTTITSPDPEINDYLIRLGISVETMFGRMELDFHRARTYDPIKGLEFHQDNNEPDPDAGELVRMATCIHNIADEDRSLVFRRPDWTGHTESFSLPIPAGGILAFGELLITDYEHGIPPDPEVERYRSLVTRFSLWRSSSE